MGIATGLAERTSTQSWSFTGNVSGITRKEPGPGNPDKEVRFLAAAQQRSSRSLNKLLLETVQQKFEVEAEKQRAEYDLAR